jgi:hypothetical protein
VWVTVDLVILRNPGEAGIVEEVQHVLDQIAGMDWPIGVLVTLGVVLVGIGAGAVLALRNKRDDA